MMVTNSVWNVEHQLPTDMVDGPWKLHNVAEEASDHALNNILKSDFYFKYDTSFDIAYDVEYSRKLKV
jgi:hypothetical protein